MKHNENIIPLEYLDMAGLYAVYDGLLTVDHPEGHGNRIALDTVSREITDRSREFLDYMIEKGA